MAGDSMQVSGDNTTESGVEW